MICDLNYAGWIAPAGFFGRDPVCAAPLGLKPPNLIPGVPEIRVAARLPVPPKTGPVGTRDGQSGRVPPVQEARRTPSGYGRGVPPGRSVSGPPPPPAAAVIGRGFRMRYGPQAGGACTGRHCRTARGRRSVSVTAAGRRIPPYRPRIARRPAGRIGSEVEGGVKAGSGTGPGVRAPIRAQVSKCVRVSGRLLRAP